MYYKDADILLTTVGDIQWMDEDETVLDITGVCLVALLLRTNRAVQFDEVEDIVAFLEGVKRLPKIGFIEAMNEGIDLTRAVLKCSSFKFIFQFCANQ